MNHSDGQRSEERYIKRYYYQRQPQPTHDRFDRRFLLNSIPYSTNNYSNDRSSNNSYKKYPTRKLIENDPYKDEPEEFTDETSLFIGDLSRTVTEEMLRDHFQNCGEIEIVDIKRDKVTKNNLGYGFVKFKTREDAEKAKLSKNQTSLQGRIIRVGWAQKNTNLFVCLVGDEDNKIDGKQLRKIFSNYGPIYDKETFVKPNKYGFVKFKHRLHAEQAKASLDGQYLPLPDGKNHTQKPVRIGWGDANTQRNCVHVQFDQKTASNADINEEDFRNTFNHYGPVVKVSLPRYSDRKLKGYGFIHYEENDNGEESAARAITALSNSILKGVEITCNFGKRQNQRHKRYAQKREHEQKQIHIQNQYIPHEYHMQEYQGYERSKEYQGYDNHRAAMNNMNIMNNSMFANGVHINPNMNMNMMMINNGIMNNHMINPTIMLPSAPTVMPNFINPMMTNIPINMNTVYQPQSNTAGMFINNNRKQTPNFNHHQMSQMSQLTANLDQFKFEPIETPNMPTNNIYHHNIQQKMQMKPPVPLPVSFTDGNMNALNGLLLPNITPLPSISNIALLNSVQPSKLPINDDIKRMQNVIKASNINVINPSPTPQYSLLGTNVGSIQNISPQLANINMDMAGLMNGFLQNHHFPPPPPNSFILPPSPPNPFLNTAIGSNVNLRKGILNPLSSILPGGISGISSMTVSANVSPTLNSSQLQPPLPFPVNLMTLPPNLNNMPSPSSGFPSPLMFNSLQPSPEPISPAFKMLNPSPAIPILHPNMMGMHNNPIMMNNSLPPPIINFPPPNPSEFNIPLQNTNIMYDIHRRNNNEISMNFDLQNISPTFLPSIIPNTK